MKKVIKIIFLVLGIILFLLYFIYPIGAGLVATFKFNKDVGNPPLGFEDIELVTSDNVKLNGWYTKPQNGMVIIVVHGSTSSRKSVKEHLEMLTDNGFGVLAFDMRGHGESEGDGAVAYNWDGTKDIDAAVSYLLKQDDVKSIGGLGLSLGGEVLLGAASAIIVIKAIVSEGATQRTIEDFLVLPQNKSFIRNYTTRLMYFAVKLFSGSKEPIRIVDSISQAKDTSFLFIAAGNEADEIEFNTYFHDLVKDRSQLWIIKDTSHIQGINSEKDSYTKKIVDFYNSFLK